MRKSIKVLISVAAEVVKIWKDTTLIMDPKLEVAIREMEAAIKKAQGGA